MPKTPYIINQRGEREPLSLRKVETAAKRVGASNQLARRIAKKIKQTTADGTSTADIYKQVRALLHKETPVAAIKFSLKEAMRKMGPAGFYFEKFVGDIYAQAGYNVKINQIVPGKCIKDFEIDFLANKQGILKVGECKYRNQPGSRVDMTIALANYARFLDIQNGTFLKKKEFQGLEQKSVIVTNTKFSGHAIKYSKCMNVELLGWRYPTTGGLEHLIEKHQLYPVTILPSVSNRFAEVLAVKDIMLVKDIAGMNESDLHTKTGISGPQLSRLVKEANLLLMK